MDGRSVVGSTIWTFNKHSWALLIIYCKKTVAVKQSYVRTIIKQLSYKPMKNVTFLAKAVNARLIIDEVTRRGKLSYGSQSCVHRTASNLGRT